MAGEKALIGVGIIGVLAGVSGFVYGMKKQAELDRIAGGKFVSPGIPTQIVTSRWKW
jgi:hypothetical protein